jgi:serine/threonine protein kinase
LAGKSLPHSPRNEADASEEQSADDALYTAQDLFGDLVDAPLEPTEQPARGSGRVKVRVAEKNRPEPPPEKRSADIPVDEMAGLVEAFGADSQTPPGQVGPPAESPRPTASPVSPEGEDFNSLLGSLEPMAPAAPAAKEADDAGAGRAHGAPSAKRGTENFADLLDNLGETPPAEPSPEVRTETASVPAPDLASPLEDLAESPPPEPPPAIEALDEGPGAWPEPPVARDRDQETAVDDLLSDVLDSVAAPRQAASRSANARPKLRVEAPKASRETAPALDLGKLADEALSATLAQPSEPAPTSTHRTRPAPPSSFGPYRLLERIAAGGMAEVFRAKRTGVEGFEKVVAVKRILPHLSDNKEFVEMFIDEAKMVAGLSHPNIVQIFDLGKIEATYFIAMEYVHGKDLRTILKQAKERGLRIPLDLSVLVVSKVCSALEYAHRKRDEHGDALKIVHRDISPQNILISFEGEVKLTDFGIAKATSKASSTDRGALRGKLLYMSPEQASGHPMDRRSDVFSLGVVFYEMITDTKPFLGSSEKGILEMVRDCKVERPRALNPKIPESLEKVVIKALEKDPERRYQDASEMYRGLERVLRERQPPASTELARFMEVLFETGSALSHDHTSDEGIEIDLSPAEPATPLTETATGGDEDVDFDDLIKRIGK